MRITIKDLQDQVEHHKSKSNMYLKKWKDAEQINKEKSHLESILDDQKKNSLEKEILRLMYIIRVLAKDPTLLPNDVKTVNQNIF